MQSLLENWPRRVLIIVAVTTVISLLMWLLELTDWAETIRIAPDEEEGEGGDMPSMARYILPFVKELVLIGVPMLLGLGILKITSWFSKSKS